MCVHRYTRVLVSIVMYVQFTNSKQGGDEELERESDIHRQKTTTHMYIYMYIYNMCTRCMCTEEEGSFLLEL
jgi:hypothetical protein